VLALIGWHEEKYPLRRLPHPEEIVIIKVDVGRIREGRAKPHRSRAAVYQIDGPLEIEQQR